MPRGRSDRSTYGIYALVAACTLFTVVWKVNSAKEKHDADMLWLQEAVAEAEAEIKAKATQNEAQD